MSDSGSEMTFWDHLSELRRTLIRSLLAIVVMTSLGLVFRDFVFDKIILRPLSGDFFIYKWFMPPSELNLVNLEISGQFIIHLRISFMLGLVLSFPYLVWEIWRFVAPALYPDEVKGVSKAFGVSSFLFYMGAAVGYFILLPLCVAFFQNYQVSGSVTNTFSLQSYISLFGSMVILLGLVFEFPILIWILAKMDIVDKPMLRKGRRYAVVLVMIVAASITPADLASMVIVAVPLYMLYEMSLWFCPDKTEENEEEE